MTRHNRQRHAIVQRFSDRERERLIKLFRQLGTDNPHEAEAARGRIDSLLRQFGKTWAGLIQLLSGGRLAIIPADVAGNVAALGSSDPDERANARRNLAELLARHRQNWNDFVEALCSGSLAGMSSSATDDTPRVNPLELVIYLLKEYVALQEHQYIAVALWILHSHCYYSFAVTPRLALRSPVADCGKTTLLCVLERLTARPQKFDSITTATICRLIDQSHPTLLIDEVDNLGLALQPNGKLRAVFNSGHRYGGAVAITEHGEPRKFSTFCPLALALPEMRGLPRTLNSRCISITMERSQRTLTRFDPNRLDSAFDAAYQQILLWRQDLQQQLQLNPDPEMPAGMRNRFADNWRLLISIADTLGWGTRAREAMVIFAREFQDADVKILLLSDLRKVFDAQAVEHLPSKTLLGALYVLDADWNEFRGVRGDQQPHRLRDSELASMLREFRIRPSNIWPPNRTAESRSAKGYRRAQFEDAWRMYCADDGTTAHGSNIRTLRRGDSGTV